MYMFAILCVLFHVCFAESLCDKGSVNDDGNDGCLDIDGDNDIGIGNYIRDDPDEDSGNCGI